jgi:hypothetical protein
MIVPSTHKTRAGDAAHIFALYDNFYVAVIQSLITSGSFATTPRARRLMASVVSTRTTTTTSS